MNLKTIITTLAASAILFSSCGDSGSDNSTIIFTDIVTLESIEPALTTFTFREKDNSPEITLVYRDDINKNLPQKPFKENTRVAISDTTETNKHSVNSVISLLAATNIYGGGEEVPVVKRQGMSDFDSSPVNLNSLWRTGEYINAIFTAISSPNPKKCVMNVDEETINDEYPKIHIIFQPDESLELKQYGVYMSYSVAELFARPGCKGVEVFFNDPNQKQKSVTFKKTDGSFTPSTPTL